MPDFRGRAATSTTCGDLAGAGPAGGPAVRARLAAPAAAIDVWPGVVGGRAGRARVAPATQASSTRWRRAVRPADDLADHLHVREPRHAQGRHPHPRRRPRRDRGGPRRAVRDPRRPALHPDALLLGRRLRDRSAVGARRRGDARDRGAARAGAHARAPRNANGSRCSGAGPTRPTRSPRSPGSPARISTALRPGSLQSVLPAPARGRRAPLLGMTESFGPYCGDRLDRDLPAGKEGSCGRPFADVEVRVVDPDTGATVEAGAVGEIQIRGRNLMRGICGRERCEVFTVDGFYPTGDLRRARRRRLPLLPGSARRHVQGQGRERLPERGRGRARRDLPRSSGRSSSTSGRTVLTTTRGRSARSSCSARASSAASINSRRRPGRA